MSQAAVECCMMDTTQTSELHHYKICPERKLSNILNMSFIQLFLGAGYSTYVTSLL